MKLRFEDLVAIKAWYYEEIDKIQKGLGPNSRVKIKPISFNNTEEFKTVYEAWLRH